MARNPSSDGRNAETLLPPRKRLIVCYDGTWNDADNGGNPTNVTRLARAIPPIGHDGVPQIVFYASGVGTGVFDSVIGGAFGTGLEKNIKDGYLFLAHNYCGGEEHCGEEEKKYAPDEIYVFGFSRGAYTARSLCGFIGSSKGLLRPNALHKLERAWKFYRTKPASRNKFEHYEDIETSVRKDVSIKCLGVWDTVGALGIPGGLFQGRNQRRYGFHDTELSSLVENAFHAIATDEWRGAFVPSLWEKPKIDIYDQVVEQVWFPGVHSNVGGSYPDTDLADLALRWMLARVDAHTFLRFTPETYEYLLPDRGETSDDKALQRLRTKWVGLTYESRSPRYLYFMDRILPTLRLVHGQRPPAKSRLSRIFPTTLCEPFAQMVHWSVMDRIQKWQSADLREYAPPNIAWALGEIQRGRIKTVSITDELKPGQPWAGTSPTRAPRPRGQGKGQRRAAIRIPAGPAQAQNGGQHPTS